MGCGCGKPRDALAASAAVAERQRLRAERIMARAAQRGGRPAVWAGKPKAEQPDET